MLLEAFRKLTPFGAVSGYQYVGFGSIWFSDFALFHRALGIDHMISLEREAHHAQRFEFNKPFGKIELRFGSSAIELPKIDLSLRTLLWLDYDDPLSLGILSDVRTAATRLRGGSALVVSVQANTPPTAPADDEDEPPRSVSSISELRERYGAQRVPTTATDNDLAGWALARLVAGMIRDEITDGLEAINAPRPIGQKIEFRQFAAIEYADGAKMVTVAGVFIDASQASTFAACGLDALEFFRADAEAFRIAPPLLTPREMRHLDTKLPLASGVDIDAGPAPLADARRYAQLYRYLPSFAPFEP